MDELDLPWLVNWAWGVPLIILNVTIHVLGLALISIRLSKDDAQGRRGEQCHRVAQALRLAAVTFLVTTLHAFEAMTWALTYRIVGALGNFKAAVLYSLGALTSFGHPNIFLDRDWQLLGALEALNGLLLMGLTTAFLYAVLRRLRPFQDL
jgi:hypothetical protein